MFSKLQITSSFGIKLANSVHRQKSVPQSGIGRQIILQIIFLQSLIQNCKWPPRGNRKYLRALKELFSLYSYLPSIAVLLPNEL